MVPFPGNLEDQACRNKSGRHLCPVGQANGEVLHGLLEETRRGGSTAVRGGAWAPYLEALSLSWAGGGLWGALEAQGGAFGLHGYTYPVTCRSGPSAGRDVESGTDFGVSFLLLLFSILQTGPLRLGME